MRNKAKKSFDFSSELTDTCRTKPNDSPRKLVRFCERCPISESGMIFQAAEKLGLGAEPGEGDHGKSRKRPKVKGSSHVRCRSSSCCRVHVQEKESKVLLDE